MQMSSWAIQTWSSSRLSRRIAYAASSGSSLFIISYSLSLHLHLLNLSEICSHCKAFLDVLSRPITFPTLYVRTHSLLCRLPLLY